MNETGEVRQLGIWICLALVVGNMIGSGIFLLPANLAPYGLNAIWGWVITIGGAMCLATVFAGLAKAMPDAGGPYDYVARSMGAPPAFLVMWSYWISTWVTNAAISIAAVSYLSTLSPGFFAVPGVAPLVAIAFVALFTAIACTGAHVSGGVQILTSVLKVMPLVAAMVIAVIVLGNGDKITLDVAARSINLDVPEAELAERRAAWKAPEPRFARGYGWMFTKHIKQANEGCDFDFLETGFGAPVDEPSIY